MKPVTRPGLPTVTAVDFRERGKISMENQFFTLQDFMVHSKGVTYIVMVAVLIGLAAFWVYLTERDE
jgi:hypothetical protein